MHATIVNLITLLLLSMERYTHLKIGLEASVPNMPQLTHIPPRLRHKNKKTTSKSNERSGNNAELNTIDVSELYDNSVQLQLNTSNWDKGTPGVGEYDISTPIIKPSYQTYQKSDQVILVKINHVGGTSSFRSDGQRFNNSMYQPTLSPGPGTYQIYPNKKHYPTSSYHQNYDLIQELLRNSREKMESMPNYKIGVPRPGMEYNGMPKHLQQMYNNINKKKQEVSIVKSLPLQKLIKLRKRTQKLPMMAKKEEEQRKQSTREKVVCDKMTETLYRLDEQIKKENKRIEKIKAILKVPNREKSKTIEQHSIQSLSVQSRRQHLFNKNMVNILFGKKTK